VYSDLQLHPEVIGELGIERDVIYDLGKIGDRAPIGPIKSSLLSERYVFQDLTSIF